MASPLSEILQVESMNAADKPSFASLLERLHAAGYSGAVTFHFHLGHPKTVEFQQRPVRVELART